ncbi:hypothetical protein GCM10023157_04170 [Gluconacetobacter asukensis]
MEGPEMVDGAGTAVMEAGAATVGAGWNRPGGLALRRRLVDRVATGLSIAATVIVLLALGSILLTLLVRGLPGLSWGTLVHTMAPPGSDGGLANAIMGSLVQTGFAAAIGTPVGLLTGIYLSEYARDGRVVDVVRFVSDMMLSAPSILVGLFVYMLLVMPFGHFSGLLCAGGAEMAGGAAGVPAVGARRRADGHSAGGGAGIGRDGAAAVHLAGEHELVAGPAGADGEPAGGDLSICGLGL